MVALDRNGFSAYGAETAGDVMVYLVRRVGMPDRLGNPGRAREEALAESERLPPVRAADRWCTARGVHADASEPLVHGSGVTTPPTGRAWWVSVRRIALWTAVV